MLPSLQLFINSLSPRGIKVVNFPSLIFMCGGTIPKKTREHYHSARHFICEYLEKNHRDIFEKVIVAERINDWFKGNLYSDLLSFEEDIAGLSATIVLFLESAGSIAELGSFCKMERIQQKLMVLMRQDHFNRESFIRLGPVSFLRDTRKRPESVRVFPWDTEKIKGKEYLKKDSIETHAGIITTSIMDAVNRVPKVQRFSSNKAGHILLLLCDVIDTMNIVQKTELAATLKKLNVSITSRYLDKHLFILEKMQLIRSNTYDSEPYYIRNTKSPFMKDRFIEFSYEPTARPKDSLRWRAIIRKEQNKDIRVSNALKAFPDI